MENEVKDALKKHLKGAKSSTIETLARRIGILPSERVWMATDLGIALAGTSLRASIEFFKSAPEISRLLDTPDMRLWGEIGRRLAATSADAAIDFFQSSGAVLHEVPSAMRPAVLRLASKQAALSANTAVECFKSSSTIIDSIGDPDTAGEMLNICLELARHSVKHSYDLLRMAPAVISQLRSAARSGPAAVSHAGPDSGSPAPSGSEAPGSAESAQALAGTSVDVSVDISQRGANPAERSNWLIERAVLLTSAFAYKSGGTAAEFFAELPRIVPIASEAADGPPPSSLEKLFANTEVYLERSGGVALQYYKAASRVLLIAGEESFDRWTALAKRVAFQGNAASYHFMKASPQIVADLGARVGTDRRAQVVAAVLAIVEEIGERNSAAAVECFKASALALGAATLTQFGEWARRGLELSQDSRRLQAYYSLESRGSQNALFNIEGGLTLDSIAHTLRLYVEGLTGRVVSIAPLGSMPEQTRIGDGKTIYLPSVVAEFEAESENFRMFKVMAAHAAGQLEFGTYSKNSPSLLAAMSMIQERIRESVGLNPRADTGPERPSDSEPGPSVAATSETTAGAEAEAEPGATTVAHTRRRRNSKKRAGPEAQISFVDILDDF